MCFRGGQQLNIVLERYRYFPYGVAGMLGGSAVVFFSYIGFDSVTSTAEEVKIFQMYKLYKKLYRKDADKV